MSRADPTGSEGSSLALYIHLPWCVRKCPYCDFNSHQLKLPRPDGAYIDALLRDFDADLPLVKNRRVDTVFFGGGTPSLFEPREFAGLLQALRRRIEFSTHAEITLEANPGTIERGHFQGYREAGINRVSLGAQTFSDDALRRLGRIHAAADTLLAVEELRAAGIDNFNLDLMYALPQQTVAEAIEDVTVACSLEPSHLSYYQLTLEPGTVFHARPPALPDEDAAWQIQSECQALLAAEGYEQYEVSAYARAGSQCRHNLNYWQFGDYLGLGAGAHGKISRHLPDEIVRTTKPKQPREYQQRLVDSKPVWSAAERQAIAVTDLPFEFALNAFRLNEGFTDELFERTTGLGRSALEPGVSVGLARGLVERANNGWKPTDLGRRFLNDLQAGFLA